MRNLVLVALVVLGLARVAGAQQQPVNPYENAPPPPAAVPPPPPGYYVQPTPGYYYPPPGYAAPIYSYPPPPVYYQVPPPPRRLGPPPRVCATRDCRPPERVRFFSINLHGAVLGINQQINDRNVVMGGAGLALRFRTRGRFAIETSIDILHAKLRAPGLLDYSPPASGPYFHVGDVTRDSVPIAITPMVYIFRNDDTRRVFNLYFLGGIGVVPTTMGLTNQWGDRVKQEFVEYEVHAGLGMELRFKWLGLQADVRGMGLFLDDTEQSGIYYTHVEDGPVPKQSWGVQGNLGASIWF